MMANAQYAAASGQRTVGRVVISADELCAFGLFALGHRRKRATQRRQVGGARTSFSSISVEMPVSRDESTARMCCRSRFDQTQTIHTRYHNIRTSVAISVNGPCNNSAMLRKLWLPPRRLRAVTVVRVHQPPFGKA